MFSLLSKRASGLKPSMTLEISAIANRLKKEGRDICSLSAGEPDFDTPDFIVDAAKKAIEDGFTKYGPAGGDPELREAIARKMCDINQIPTKAENIQITNGGKQAIFNLLQVIINPGDEVIIPAPYWLSYPEMVNFAGGKSVLINSSPENEFALDIQQLERKITNKTKLIILNSPCNPTGKILGKDVLYEIAGLLRKHEHIQVLSDEIYEYLISENETHFSLSSIAKDLRDRIFIVNGFAKSWAMTGWRIGYLQGAKDVIKKATALQSQSTSNVCSFVQKGALAAISECPEGINYMIESYNKRRRVLIEGIEKIDELSLAKPTGAFYAFPCLKGNHPDSLSFCKTALEEQGLAIIPGTAFGESRGLRLSCSVSCETIEDGLNRLQKALQSVEKNKNQL